MSTLTSCPKCYARTERRELFRFFYDHCPNCDVLPAPASSPLHPRSEKSAKALMRETMDEFLDAFVRLSGYVPSYLNLNEPEFEQLAKELQAPDGAAAFNYRGVNVGFYSSGVASLKDRTEELVRSLTRRA